MVGFARGLRRRLYLSQKPVPLGTSFCRKLKDRTDSSVEVSLTEMCPEARRWATGLRKSLFIILILGHLGSSFSACFFPSLDLVEKGAFKSKNQKVPRMSLRFWILAIIWR